MAANAKIQPGHPDDKGFAKIEMLLEATGGLSLSQVCSVIGLEGSTIQNWVKRGWVEHPVGKKYEEVHIARILIINALKECIKLEHISQLMRYVNGNPQDGDVPIIKESTLYDYLCEALKQSAKSEDHSKTGVEAVINNVIKDYDDANPESRARIRKALTLMIFACVCTDVKRRVEAMLGLILDELNSPEEMIEELVMEEKPAVPRPKLDISIDIEPEEVIEDASESRKTVSQALREWDISSVEKIIIDHDEETRNNVSAEEDVNVEAEVEVEKEEKKQSKPWYVRRSSKQQ